nr:MAG TPA: hypothetical protein [Caudoviricetes sp.]
MSRLSWLVGCRGAHVGRPRESCAQPEAAAV